MLEKIQRGNQEWTIQRHLQHWAHETHDEDKPNNTAQKNNKLSNTNPSKEKRG